MSIHPELTYLPTNNEADSKSLNDPEAYTKYVAQLANEYRARRDAKALLAAADTQDTAGSIADGAAFILDQPDKVPARWGNYDEVLWGKGEALMIVGPPGVGKTTVMGQLLRALIGLDRAVLGYHVEPVQRVLYLAMDRPKQIGRALSRNFKEHDRAALAEHVVFHQGPPPEDLAANTDALLNMAREHHADVVVVDSLKDAAIGLSEDAVGAGYNRARQKVLAAGIDIVELHHQKKAGSNGGKPNTLADVYGSTWLTSGAGSVVLLWGDAGDPVVRLSHLMPVMEPVGPFDIIHDHTAGRSTVDGVVDLVALASETPQGMTVGMAAERLFEADKPTKNQRQKARREIEKLVESGHLVVAAAMKNNRGQDVSTYRPGKGHVRQGLFAVTHE
ncbi:AAA family ATPase [Kocuria sp. WRN011]|uniref:AAA family ATPase n=1 Tax=Kocuria sp. WRN011 TaxID=2029858 RepID=UPI000BB01078|nr:AAA family ATPase [Kocuria sp. WRN011]PBB08425.1 AAA family ATPase [Kocuria sp. WRN011]